MAETLTCVERVRDRKDASMAPLEIVQTGRCRILGPIQRAKWHSAVLAELAEPGHAERLCRAWQLVAGAEFERSEPTSVGS